MICKGMLSLSLSLGPVEENLREGPWRICKEGSENRHLSPLVAPLGDHQGDAALPGILRER